MRISVLWDVIGKDTYDSDIREGQGFGKCDLVSMYTSAAQILQAAGA